MGRNLNYLNKSDIKFIKRTRAAIYGLLVAGLQLYFPAEFVISLRRSTIWMQDICKLVKQHNFMFLFRESIKYFKKLFKLHQLKCDISDEALKELRRIVKSNDFGGEKNTGNVYNSDEYNDKIKNLWTLIYSVMPQLRNCIDASYNCEFSIRYVETCHKLVNIYRSRYNNDWINILLFIRINIKVFNMYTVVALARKIFIRVRNKKDYTNIFK